MWDNKECDSVIIINEDDKRMSFVYANNFLLYWSLIAQKTGKINLRFS